MDNEKIFDFIKKEELVQLAASLVNIPSQTGQEQDVGEFVLNWLDENGFRPVRQEVEQGRLNAVGILRGTGGGSSLMFNSHMDTAFTGTKSDVFAVGKITPERLPKAIIENDRIIGQGIVNCKGPLACFLIAAKAIKNSGVELKGDLIVAAVCGEIGKAQIDEFQGPAFRSKGLGTRHLLTNGITSDYAVVAEPSQFALTWALPGAVYVKITTKGVAAYTPFTDRKNNSIIKAMEIVKVISQWAEEYEVKNIYNFARGEIHPKVNIGAIRGGLPGKPNYSPALCSIYVDIRTAPGVDPYRVAKDLENALKGYEIDFEVYLAKKGYEARNVDGLVKTIDSAHNRVFGANPENIHPGYTSMWNDNNVYSELGIPCVKIGPSPKDGAGNYFYQYISDLVNAAKMYALIAIDICNQNPPRP